MSDALMSVPTQDAAISTRFEALYEQGLYRQALDTAEAAWGPLRRWQGEARRLLGARVAAQLGLFRTSAALVFATWRAAQRAGAPSFELHYSQVRTRFNLHGPYAGRRALRELEPRLVMDAEQRARWQALAGVIHGSFRDWERAHACVDEAIALTATPADFLFERAWLQEMQDRYEEALATLEALPPGSANHERMRVQSRARLLEITGRREAAIDLLSDSFARIESVDMGLRLHRLLVDADRLDAAEACLARLRTLAPAGEAYVGQDLALAHAEALYRRGDMDGAFAAFAPVRGYFFRKVKENLESARHSGTRRALEVPFIRQHHMTCAPATFAAIWRYHGHFIDHLSLAAAICYDGTSDLAERRWLEGQGWAVREFELNLEDIRTLIDAGCPVGLATVEPGSAHMQAVIGYDTRKGIYLLRDPYYPTVQEILIEGAHEAYAASGPRCIVAVPPERRDWLFALPLRQAPLYDEYFGLQQALEANRRDDALACIARLEALAPHHRLTLWAQRSLARYDHDSPRQLHFTNRLLEQFPHDLNLLTAKSYLLGDLGRAAERLQFLEDCRREGHRHPYLLQALAEQMAQDNRRNAETAALLHAILRRQPLNAAAWWTLASLHWDGLARDEAFECYRLCLCLEDKMEGYAASYFKAARFLRRDDEALAYLQRRITWLGERSANPYITYARALDLLERLPEALAVLEEALQRHPDDAWLVEEAIGFFCNAGEYARAEALLAAKGALLAEVTRLHRQARLLAARAEPAAELACYRRMLALQPRSELAATNIARLLQETESPEAALAFLDAQLADSPYNLWLLHEKLPYLQKLPLDIRRAQLAAMHALHPEDSRLTLAWSRVLRADGEHEAALRLLQQAIGIDADEVRLHLALGDTYLELEQPAPARAAYERAILIAVDADNAFEKLLATHVSFEAKRQALQFIHAELMRQVSLGNGILEFQGLARRYLPDTEVQAFLEVAVETRPDLWQSWIALGNFLIETGQLDAAHALLSRGVTCFALVPRFWLDRGEVERLRGQFSAAESDIRAALAINPGYATATTRLADVLEQQARPAEALAVIEQGLRRDPHYAPYHGYRADLLWRQGRHGEAFAAAMAALQADPDYGWAWNRLAEWGRELGRSAEVAALAEACVARFPDSVSLWKQCAELAPERARRHECLARAQALAPQRSDLLLARCDLYVEDGRIDAARALIAATYGDQPRPSDVLTYEAWLTAETGRLEEAIAQLEAVVAQDPGHYNAWRLLARWHDAAGRGEDCCRCARHCVGLYPQNASVLGMAADFLLRHLAPDNEVARRLEARDYLQRAITQDHTNLFNFLTLADLYLDERDLDECEQLFARQLVDAQNCYVVARRLRLALLRGQIEAAQDHYRYLLGAGEDNEWLVLQPLHWFGERQQKAAAWACLQEMAAAAPTAAGELAATLESAVPAATANAAQAQRLAARAWMSCVLADHASAHEVATALAGVADRPGFWREAVAHALGQGQASAAQLAPLLLAQEKNLRADALLWTALANHRAARSDWAALRAMSRRDAPPAGVTARALYFCSVAWRMQADWRRAREFAALARQCERDDSQHNLMFWEQFDAGLQAPAKVDPALLAALDLRELTRVEALLLEVLQAVAAVPAAFDGAAARALRRQLRGCWQAHAGLLAEALVQHARYELWRALWRQGRGHVLWRMARAYWCVWL